MSERQEHTTAKFDLYQKIEELIGIELKSLGLFRILIGAIILIDLIVRATAIEAHYTDIGVVPRSLVIQHGEQPWLFSLHMLSGGVWLQGVLFLVTAGCAIALLIGYKSRIACFCCWLLMLSLHIRNPFINNLGDWLLVDLLFWGIFLPLGARFSIDGVSKPKEQILPARVLSIATLAILLQICFVYVFSVQHKISPIWHTDGTAIQFALHLDRITTMWGQALLALPQEWLSTMTIGTLILERWGPLLAFVPFFLGPWRTSVAFVFIGFHLGLAVFFKLGLFPYICIAAWVLFLPAWFWQKIGNRMMELFQLVLTFIGNFKSFTPKKKEIKITPGALETIVAVFFLFLILSSGLLYGRLMGEAYYEMVYKHVEPIVDSINLRQRWDMFSPHPPKRDGWFVVAGYTQQKEVRNLQNLEEKLTWERPANLSNMFVNQRWLKYHEWVMDKWDPHAEYLARYYSRRYEKTSGERLEDVKIYFMEELTLDNLQPSRIVRRQLN